MRRRRERPGRRGARRRRHTDEHSDDRSDPGKPTGRTLHAALRFDYRLRRARKPAAARARWLDLVLARVSRARRGSAARPRGRTPGRSRSRASPLGAGAMVPSSRPSTTSLVPVGKHGGQGADEGRAAVGHAVQAREQRAVAGGVVRPRPARRADARARRRGRPPRGRSRRRGPIRPAARALRAARALSSAFAANVVAVLINVDVREARSRSPSSLRSSRALPRVAGREQSARSPARRASGPRSQRAAPARSARCPTLRARAGRRARRGRTGRPSAVPCTSTSRPPEAMTTFMSTSAVESSR